MVPLATEPPAKKGISWRSRTASKSWKAAAERSRVEYRIPPVYAQYRFPIEPPCRHSQENLTLAGIGIHRANGRTLQSFLERRHLEHPCDPLSGSHLPMQVNEERQSFWIRVCIPHTGHASMLIRVAGSRKRRSSPAPELPEEMKYREITTDFRRYEAHRGEQAVELTRKEYGVLRVLAAREGLVVTRDELLETVWGYDAPRDDAHGGRPYCDSAGEAGTGPSKSLVSAYRARGRLQARAVGRPALVESFLCPEPPSVLRRTGTSNRVRL